MILDTYLYIYFFVIGALFGSFGNVVIYRLPKGESVVMPRSRCGSCSQLIPWYHNIPILSWLILRGRCCKCKASYSVRYLVVELITAISFCLIYDKFGLSITTFEYLLLAFGLVVISFIDLDHMIIPDVFSLSGIGLGLVGAFINPERSFTEAALGAVIGGGSLFLLSLGYYLIKKEEGLGGGDVKLLAWLGAYLGVLSLPFIILVSSFLGIFFSVVLMLKYKTSLKTAIPFGPFLSLAGFIYIFFGEAWNIYLFPVLVLN